MNKSNEDDYDLVEFELNIQQIDYHKLFDLGEKNLYVASSGGRGHISAIKAIQSLCDESSLPKHVPVPYENKKKTISGCAIRLFTRIRESSFIKTTPDEINLFHFPIGDNKFTQGIRKLNTSDPRTFVDFALDAHSSGYEEISFYNQLQQESDGILPRVLELQSYDDWFNHKEVVKFFFDKLMEANYAKDDPRPYRKIIITQPLGLAAICDAAFQYNNCMQMREDNKNHQDIIIELFITDLPTEGAKHFFNPLAKLNEQQKKLLNIHAVSIEEAVLRHFFKKNYLEIMDFNAIYSINPGNNPMVHPAFKKDEDTTELTDWFLNSRDQIYQIDSDERVATIMLGGQAGISSPDYIESLLENNIDKVFILGGKNTEIKNKIDKLLINKSYQLRCIPLDFEEPEVIAMLMRKSVVFICGSGGLTIMELLAVLYSEQPLPFKQPRLWLLHRDNSSYPKLKNLWEEANGNKLIELSFGKTIKVLKTCPGKIRDQLQSMASLQDSAPGFTGFKATYK